MRRYDLRGYKGDFLPRMCEILRDELHDNEVGIFLFEIGDFSNISKSAMCINDLKYTLLNSLRFNEVDWTIVVKKAKPDAFVESSANNSNATNVE